jgi:exosortase
VQHTLEKRPDIPVIDPLSISVPLLDKPPNMSASEPIGWSPLQSLDAALPLSEKHRNGLFLTLLAVVVLGFWGPLNDLYALTKQQEHYSHIVLIPWLSLYAFYVDRTAILSSRQWSPLLGLSLVAAGAIGAWQADGAISGPDVLTVQMVSFVVICWGFFLLCYGSMAARRFSFGLLFLLCMVPLPTAFLHAVIVFLQQYSAEATDVVFTMLGIPYYRDGFIFGLPHLTIHIAEECSGIRSTLSLIITSLVAGHFFLRSLWGKWLLVLIVVPLAIVKNAFRIVGLSLLANYVDPSFITDSVLHRSGGIPLFVVSLAILLFLAWLVRSMEKRTGYYLPEGLHAKV